MSVPKGLEGATLQGLSYFYCPQPNSSFYASKIGDIIPIFAFFFKIHPPNLRDHLNYKRSEITRTLFTRKVTIPRMHSYTEEQKFKFIESKLYWIGLVKRRDLMTEFELSESTAAATFRAYTAIRPGVLVLDRTIRGYTPEDGFEPMFYQPDLKDCPLKRVDSGLSVPVRRQVLDALGQSIRESKSIFIKYTSIKDEYSEREIIPLFLIEMISGYPPALFAWCLLKQKHRIFQIALIEHAEVKSKFDRSLFESDVQYGTIEFNGERVRVPKYAMYAVASQLISVPELRDKSASEMIANYVRELEKTWIDE